MDPSLGSRMPPDDLSRSERRARLDEWPTACESVRGPSPTSRLVHARNDVVGGSEALGPEPLSHSPPMGKSPATPVVVNVSRVVAIAGEAARALDPGQTRQPSIAQQRTSPAGALPPSKLRTEQWADRPRPGQRAKLRPCFLPVNSVDRSKRAYSRL